MSPIESPAIASSVLPVASTTEPCQDSHPHSGANSRACERAWRATSIHLAALVENNHHEIVDVIRVGSTVARPNLEASWTKDIDSLVILREDLSLLELVGLRERLDAALALRGETTYHYKLFTLPQLKSLALYDGFRLFEMRESHEGLFRRDLLRRIAPRLDSRNFVNSLLIQATFLAHHRSTLSQREVRLSFARRVQRNAAILETAGDRLARPVHDVLSDFASTDRLFSQALALVCNPDGRLQAFPLSRYFARVPHEYVNKGAAYCGLPKGPASTCGGRPPQP